MKILPLIKIIYLISKYRVLDLLIVKTNYAVKILYRLVITIFYPYNILCYHTEISGQKLLEFFKQLGPIYIKFGQTISTRPDIIGQDFASNLRGLQDRLDPFSFEVISDILERCWGADIKSICTYIDQQPIASASVAQVHKAKLICGSQVAVKVLRPKIHQRYSQDLTILRQIANLLNKIMPQLIKFKITEIIEIFDQNMQLELNLLMEAANCSELQDNLIKDHDVILPKVYWHLTTSNVLVTQWIDGISIYNTAELTAKNIDTKLLATKMAVMFFNQTYRDGFFHADLHPGNIFVTNEGRIALIDFGIMGRLPDIDRLAVAQILHNLLKRDYIAVAKVHIKAGYIPKETNLMLFAQYCRSVCEPIAGLALKDVCISKILAQMFQIIEIFSLQIQPQLVMLQKSMVIIEGIGKTLDPDINMWQLAYPWMEEWAIKNISIEARIVAKLKQFIASSFENII